MHAIGAAVVLYGGFLQVCIWREGREAAQRQQEAEWARERQRREEERRREEQKMTEHRERLKAKVSEMYPCPPQTGRFYR